MRCPFCSAMEDKVIETRVAKDGDVLRRRRQCAQCGARFTTYETIIPAEVFVIKKDGTRQEFQPEKILSGIRQACWKRSISDEQIDHTFSNITARITAASSPTSEIPSRTIGEIVMEELKALDEVAYVRFASVYRHFKDAEAFISEVHKLNDAPDSSETQP